MKFSLLTFLKWVFLVLFIGLVVLEFYSLFTAGFSSTKFLRLLCVLVLIGIIVIKKGYVWVFAVCFFLYGLYDLVIASSLSSSGSPFDFTGTLRHHFMGRADKTVSRYVHLVPIISYLLLLLFFSMPMVRKRFHILRKKPPKVKSYL